MGRTSTLKVRHPIHAIESIRPQRSDRDFRALARCALPAHTPRLRIAERARAIIRLPREANALTLPLLFAYEKTP